MTDLQRLWATYLVDYSERDRLRPWWKKRGRELARRDGWVATVGHMGVSAYDETEQRRDYGGGRRGTGACLFPWAADSFGLYNVIRKVDALDPLPCPEPACGQVWVWPDIDRAVMITGVQQSGALWTLAINGMTQRVARQGLDPDFTWPLPGGHLVGGPGAPWSPPDTPEEP